jgi:hypothetical protein
MPSSSVELSRKFWIRRKSKFLSKPTLLIIDLLSLTCAKHVGHLRRNACSWKANGRRWCTSGRSVRAQKSKTGKNQITGTRSPPHEVCDIAKKFTIQVYCQGSPKTTESAGPLALSPSDIADFGTRP